MNGNASNRFWRWLLSRVTPGQKEWNPPPDTEDITPNESSSSEEMTKEGVSEPTMKEPQ
jgi:hypothetical protein